MGGPDAFAGSFAGRVFGGVLQAGRAADLRGQRRDARLGVGEQRPERVERHPRERDPGGDAAAGAVRDHDRFFSTDARVLPSVNPAAVLVFLLRYEKKNGRTAPAPPAGAVYLRPAIFQSRL